MKIQFLGAHNIESQDTRFISLLIDDTIVLDAGGLTSSLSFEAQRKLKAVLLTHCHYDHIRDVPALAMNFFLWGANIKVYSTESVYDALATNLLNGVLYPKFMEWPEGKPAIRFNKVEPYKSVQVEGYDVLPVPVNHTDLTVGYQVRSPDGTAVFYTADTGPGLSNCWENISPELLIIEVSGSNSYEEVAREAHHLTPGMLKQELISFRELKGYLPQVVTVHMAPSMEQEIAIEISAVADALNNPITLAYEGMQLNL